MWGAALGLAAGGLGPSLAQNLFGLRPDNPTPPPWPEPIEGNLRIDRSRSYGSHRRQRFDLVRPPAACVGPFPGVVLFHGGGFARGSKWYVGGIAHALARRGFAVVNADYRLLPHASLSTIVSDAIAATRYTYDNADTLEIDRGRLSTMGRSAGGHLALLAAYTAEVPLRAVVSEAGPTDLDPVMWDGSMRGELMRRFTAGEDFRSLSPVHVANASAPPTLLVHGCRDRTVPFAHSRILEVRLDALGVPVRLVALPRTGHNPLWWRWRLGFAIACRWLLDRTAPASVAALPFERETHAGVGLRSDDRARGDGAGDHHPDGDP